MITHPQAYNIALRPYYVHMTSTATRSGDALAAAILLDVIENADPLPYDNEQWMEMPIKTMFDILTPFVPQNAVRNALQWLEADGLIQARHDPNFPMKRTKQYRLRESEVQKRIDCWTAQNEALNNAPLRIIRAVERNQVESAQIMHGAAMEGGTEIRVRGNDDLSSKTQNKQAIGRDINYKSTMHTLHGLLCIETFPVKDKRPAPTSPTDQTPWEWSAKRLGRPGMQPATFHAWRVATGYGMVPIKGSRLVFLDIDRAEFERELVQKLPRLRETYKQTRGDHSCYAVKLPSELDGRWQIADDQGEIASIRNYNNYQVGAGSRHPSGDIYQVANLVPAMELTEVEAGVLFSVFEARNASKGKRPTLKETLVVQKLEVPAKMEKRLKAWAKRGIESELQKLSFATEGTFNDTLYKAASRLINLSKVTGDSQSTLHGLLYDVCERSGYIARDGRSQATSTIQSGFKDGNDMPLQLPEWADKKVSA